MTNPSAPERIWRRTMQGMRISKRVHIGIFPQATCWKWRFSKEVYAKITYYHFWRFYLSVDKQ